MISGLMGIKFKTLEVIPVGPMAGKETLFRILLRGRVIKYPIPIPASFINPRVTKDDFGSFTGIA
jgi:hypothetical protein